jgi:hypothetical protein
MVMAIRAGKKTQTRRLLKSLVDLDHVSALNLRYAVDDLLWVRESWRTESDYYNDLSPSDLSGEEKILFDADSDWSNNKSIGRRRASIHMPHWASRITLEITDVRVQRVQDITEEDAQAEGARRESRTVIPVNGKPLGATQPYSMPTSYRGGFANLWDRINGASGFGWDVNPFVAAFLFRVLD